MDKKSDIGKAFAEAFKEYSIEPAPQVWENVSNAIPKTPKSFFSGKGIFVITAAVAFVSVVSLLLFLHNDDKAVVEAEKQPVIKENVNVGKPAVVNMSDEHQAAVNMPIENNNKEIIRESSGKNNQVESSVDKSENKENNKVDNNLTTEEKSVISQKNVVLISRSNVHTPNVNQTESNHRQHDEIMVNKKPEKPAKNDEISKVDTTVKFSDDPVICFGEDAVLKVFGGESYQWNNGDVTAETVVQPVSNSTYSVTVTDKYGSVHTHEFIVSIDKECSTVFIPSAFSPNGDGNNDIFMVYGRNILEYEITIMNRQGQVVYTSKDINHGWDGTFKGEYMQPQVFVYTIIYKNSRGRQSIKKGQFTLIR